MIQTQLERRLFLAQTQGAHTLLEHCRNATPLQALWCLYVVGESLGRRGDWSGGHLHLWLNVDNGYNGLPLKDTSDLVRVPGRSTSICCLTRWRVSSEGLPESITEPLNECL